MSANEQNKTLSRDDRAKLAKHTINKVVPKILESDRLSAEGIKRAQLIVHPQPNPVEVLSFSKDVPAATQSTNISIKILDTLLAAQELGIRSVSSSRKNVALLNMASPLRPGGGILTGASSQEESICARSTLLPSLRENWYRLPEVGGIWTPDVCVFKLHTDTEELLPKNERFHVDVVTAAMIRFPEVKLDVESGETVYEHGKDRELTVEKIRSVLRILRAHRVENIVLGAWGCGAYGNPVYEIARTWKRLLERGEKSKKDKTKGDVPSPWGFNEVVFAIKDEKLAKDFAKHSGYDIVI